MTLFVICAVLLAVGVFAGALYGGQERPLEPVEVPETAATAADAA